MARGSDRQAASEVAAAMTRAGDAPLRGPDLHHRVLGLQIFAVSCFTLTACMLSLSLLTELPVSPLPYMVALPLLGDGCRVAFRSQSDERTSADVVHQGLLAIAYGNLAFGFAVVLQTASANVEVMLMITVIPFTIILTVSSHDFAKAVPSSRALQPCSPDEAVCVLGGLLVLLADWRLLVRSVDPVETVLWMVPHMFSFLAALFSAVAQVGSLRSARQRLDSEMSTTASLLIQQESLNAQLSRYKQAVVRMLSGVCDVVFSLSSDLDIVQTTPQLLDLVMPGHPGPTSCLFGVSLNKFTDEPDRLASALQLHSFGNVSESVPASALPFTICDSEGRAHIVELYHTPLSDDEHLIALRRTSASQDQEGGESAGAAVTCGLADEGHDDIPNEADDVSLWMKFDAGDLDCPVWESSPELGVEPGTSLLASMQPHLRSRFTDWVYDRWTDFDRAEQYGLEAPPPPRLARVEFRLPDLVVTAPEARFHMCAEQQGEGGLTHMPVVVRLTRPRMRPRRGERMVVIHEDDEEEEERRQQQEQDDQDDEGASRPAGSDAGRAQSQAASAAMLSVSEVHPEDSASVVGGLFAPLPD